MIDNLDGFNNIFQCSTFHDEFIRLFKSGDIERYKNWLIGRLRKLDDLGKLSTDGVSFEKVKNCKKDIYSIRYTKSKKNPRVLYVFFKDDQTVVLLTDFLEKSVSDYDRAINHATNLVKQLEGEDIE